MTVNAKDLRDESQLADFAQYRASMYAAAAAAFTVEPSVDQLESLIQAACSSNGDDVVRESELALYDHLRTYQGAELEALRTKVATEYAELFVGPRPPLAPLYESVYVGAVKRLNTDVTMNVRDFYERHGFTVVKRNSVPNDHMGYELEFMSRLCAREAQAYLDGDSSAAAAARKNQQAFLKQHVCVWAGLFADRIAQAWCADYYAAWSRFVRDFCDEDQGFLASFDEL